MISSTNLYNEYQQKQKNYIKWQKWTSIVVNNWTQTYHFIIVLTMVRSCDKTSLMLMSMSFGNTLFSMQSNMCLNLALAKYPSHPHDIIIFIYLTTTLQHSHLFLLPNGYWKQIAQCMCCCPKWSVSKLGNVYNPKSVLMMTPWVF
jgi:hypothetical protein